MSTGPIPLLLAGAAATTLISLASGVARHDELAAAVDRAGALPGPAWLVILAAMLALYGAGLAAGWLLWGRK